MNYYNDSNLHDCFLVHIFLKERMHHGQQLFAHNILNRNSYEAVTVNKFSFQYLSVKVVDI